VKKRYNPVQLLISAVHWRNALIQSCVVTGNVTAQTAAMKVTAVSYCSVTVSVSLSSVAKITIDFVLKIYVRRTLVQRF